MSFIVQSIRSSFKPLLVTPITRGFSRPFSTLSQESPTSSSVNQLRGWFKKNQDSLKVVGFIVGAGGLAIEAHRTLATKTEIGEVRTELKSDIKEVRIELKSDLKETRAELKSDISVLGNKIDSLKDVLLQSSQFQASIYHKDNWEYQKQIQQLKNDLAAAKADKKSAAL